MARSYRRNQPITQKLAPTNLTAPLAPDYSGLNFTDPNDYINQLNTEANALKPGEFMFNAAMLPEEDPAIVDAMNRDIYNRNVALADAYNQAVQGSGWTPEEEVGRSQKSFLPETNNSYLFGHDVFLPKIIKPSEYIEPPDLPEFEKYKDIKTKLNVQKASRPKDAVGSGRPEPTGKARIAVRNPDNDRIELVDFTNSSANNDDVRALYYGDNILSNSYATVSSTLISQTQFADGVSQLTGKVLKGEDGAQLTFKNIMFNLWANKSRNFEDAAKNVKINNLQAYGEDNLNTLLAHSEAYNDTDEQGRKDLRKRARAYSKPIVVYKSINNGKPEWKVELLPDVLFETINEKVPGTNKTVTKYVYYVTDNGKTTSYASEYPPSEANKDKNLKDKVYSAKATSAYASLSYAVQQMIINGTANNRIKFSVNPQLSNEHKMYAPHVAGDVWTKILFKNLTKSY